MTKTYVRNIQKHSKAFMLNNRLLSSFKSANRTLKLKNNYVIKFVLSYVPYMVKSMCVKFHAK